MRSENVAISARNLSKTYRLFGHPGDRIKQFFSLGLKQYHHGYTALTDISFDIKKGETVGIVGRNGSGKSTLLQLICGILKPTSGTVQVNGRISALLELGAGFNPEFTGRENVYFQGALMGFTSAQMDGRFDEIASFADIGDFIDQPVRTYSSGMYLRLAFAVAVNVDPEILLVDEALAVGDAGFRSRCFRRIGELRNVGCTILFVSHDVEQIVRLCDQAMLIDEGELLFSGSPEAVVGRYHHLMGAGLGARPEIRKMYKAEKGGATDTTVSTDESAIDKAVEYHDHDLCPESSVSYEPNGALIEAVQIVALSGERVNQLLSGRTYRCAYRVCFTNAAVDVRFAMLIKTSAGMDLGGAMSAPASVGDGASVSQGSIANVEFEFNCMLNPGVYHLSVAVFGSVAGLEYALHGITGAEVFRVVAEARHLAMANVDFGCRAAVQFVDPEAQ